MFDEMLQQVLEGASPDYVLDEIFKSQFSRARRSVARTSSSLHKQIRKNPVVKAAQQKHKAVRKAFMAHPLAAKVSKDAYKHQKGKCPHGSHWSPSDKTCVNQHTHGILNKRIHLTKKSRAQGDAKGAAYWQGRNRRNAKVVGAVKTVAKVVGTEMIPGGTAINAARLAAWKAKRSKTKRKAA